MARLLKPAMQRGFTLVEMLVVVVVVAILTACTLAGLPKVESLATRAKCASNLRQVAGALSLYAHERDGELPSSDVPRYGEDEGIWFSYATLILPYLGLEPVPSSSKIFTCPVNKTTGLEHPNYLFNSGNQYQPSFPGLAGKRLQAISGPTKTILVFELSAIFPASWHDPKKGSAGAYKDAHALAAFVDGHVSYVPFFWDGSALSVAADPPPDYEYKWSDQ